MGRRLSQAIQREAMLHAASQCGDTAECPTCGENCPVEVKCRTINSVDGPSEIGEPVCHCRSCDREFFPQREALGLDGRQLSPGMVAAIVFTGGEVHSSQRAATLLDRLGMPVSCKQKAGSGNLRDAGAVGLVGGRSALPAERPA